MNKRDTRIQRIQSFKLQWYRKGYMRVLSFDPYEHKDDSTEKVPDSLMIFGVLHQSITNPNARAGTDKASIRKVIKLMDAFESLTDLKFEGTPKELRILCKSGGSMVLEDAEFELLKQCWDEYRATLPRAGARDIIKIEDFIDGVKSMSAEEYTISKASPSS